MSLNKGFDPSQFAVCAKREIDPDADWMHVSEKFPAGTFKVSTKNHPYIPAIPREFLRKLSPAKDSLELLLVALAEMRMRKVKELAIGPSMWEKVGNPSRSVRTRLLRQISWLPDSTCRIIPRQGRPHLLVAGLDWPRPVQSKPVPALFRNGLGATESRRD